MAGWALLLDFDGTLVDLAATPDAVVVEPGLPAALRALHDALGGAVALVTGRTVADIDAFLPDLGIDICGLHGLERRIGGHLSRPAGLAELGPEIDALRVRLAGCPGVLVEDKRVGVAVHWRLAPEQEAEAVAALSALAARLGPGYRIQEGKAVREIVPAAAGKGKAIGALMERPPYLGRRPVFAGDDRTDEHGFLVVDAIGGRSIKVGPGATEARCRVPSAAAFRHWLFAWAAGTASPEDLDPA